MEDLSGGSLSLEHRYDIGNFEGVFAGVHVYRGTQHPMSKPIWIHAIPHPSKDREVRKNWVEKIRKLVLNTSKFRNTSLYEIIDFGEIDGAPFVVYERDNFHRLSNILEIEGVLQAPMSEMICSNIAEACILLEDNGLTHGSINPAFVFLGDEGEVKLIQSGFGFSKDDLDELKLDSLSALYSIDNEGNNSDAYGIACLGSELLSGVHPFLDAEGDRILEEPAHPAEFGVNMDFSEILFAQFDPKTRDLEAFIAEAWPVDEVEEPEEKIDEAPATVNPKPRKNQKVVEGRPKRPKKDILFWIALGIIGTLLGTLFFQSMQQKSAKKDTPLVRPQTFTLTSTPSEAEVFLNDKTIGLTPFEIDPKMLEKMNLKIRKDGFSDQVITISSDDDRPTINITLKK